MIQRGANLEATDDLGRTALAIAVETHLKPILKYLLDAGANINSRDAQGVSPLMLANVEILSTLLQRGADLSSTDYLGRSALHHAASRGDLDTVLQLLGFGFRWVQQDYNGCSPLCYSLRSPSAAIHSFALDFSKDYSSYSPNHEPYLLQLCHRRSWDIMSEMLEKGDSRKIRDIVDQSSNRFPPALYQAAHMGKIEPLRMLIRAGAKIEVAWAEHGKPLGVACAMGRLDAVKFLIENGAKTSWTDPDGKVVTVFEKAQQHQNVLAWLQNREVSNPTSLETSSSKASENTMPPQCYQYRNHLREEEDIVGRLKSSDQSRMERRASFFSESILHKTRIEPYLNLFKRESLTKAPNDGFVVATRDSDTWSETLDDYKDMIIQRASPLTPPKRYETFPLAPFILRCKPNGPWVIF